MTRLSFAASAAALLLAASTLPAKAADLDEGWYGRHREGRHHGGGWHERGHRHVHGYGRDGWAHRPRIVWVYQTEPYIAPDLVYNTPPDPWAKRRTRYGSGPISVRY